MIDASGKGAKYPPATLSNSGKPLRAFCTKDVSEKFIWRGEVNHGMVTIKRIGQAQS